MKTYCVPLIFEKKEDKELLLNTLNANLEVWNYLSKFIYKDIKKKITKNTQFSAIKLHEKTYKKCKKEFPNTPSQVIIRAREDVISTYKQIKSNKHKLNHAPCKKKPSMRLDKRLCTFKGYSIQITTINGKNKRINCKFFPYPKMEELFKYTFHDPLIYVRKNRIFLAITFDTPEPIFIENSAIGIDLGIKRIATTSEGKIIKNTEFIKRKRQIRYLKGCLKYTKKSNRKPNKKHSDSARKHLRKLQRKEENYSKNYIHHLTNDLLKTNSNTLVFEDLNSLKDKDRGHRQNNRASQIPFEMIYSNSEYKAQALGKRAVTVNPYRTSLDDYRGIAPGVRKGCRYYASDGKIFDADHQASITVAGRWCSERKLPISFVEPIDGKYGAYKLSGQGVSQPPIRLAKVRDLSLTERQTSHVQDALARGS